MKKKLKITFIIPFTEKTGGIAVVLEYYRQLSLMGHQVTICYPLLPYMRLILESKPLWKKFLIWLIHLKRNLFPVIRQLVHFSEHFPVNPVPFIHNVFVPDSDAVIATAWPTAYDVAKLATRKGQKFYLIQGYEIWGGYTENVHASYNLPLNLITISPFLTELVRSKPNRYFAAEIHNGVRLDCFYPPTEKDFSQPNILMMAHELELKGTQDGLQALSIIKKNYPHVRITLFGMCSPPAASFEFEYYQSPKRENLLTLYQKANIFLSPSHSEGWHLPPMEAMACKCAVVATETGCIPSLNNGRNIAIAKMRDPKSLSEVVSELIESQAKLVAYAEEGHKTIRNYAWEKSAQKLEKCLIKHIVQY